MRKLYLYSTLLIVFLGLSSLATGQYTGINPDVAFEKTGDANDSIIGFGPARALDGDPATYLSIPGDAPAWVSVDLEGFFLIDGFGFDIPTPMVTPMGFTFQVSSDGTTWTTLGGGSATLDGSYGYDVVSPEPIKFVKFDISDKDPVINITEIYVYGTELPLPNPPLAVEPLSITADGFTAHWDPVDADGYVLSVATDLGFTNFVDGYENYWVALYEQHNVTGLEPGTQYFYRLRSYNLSGSSLWGNKISVTTLQESQDISFGTLDAMTYGDADLTLSASASSGLAVQYASSDQSVATVSGSTLSIVGVGTATITASQPGNSQYLPAEPVDQVLEVGVKELTVSGAVAEDKVYDGTTLASITGATLEGVVGGDQVNLASADVGEFAQADTGTDIAVSVSMKIVGPDNENYSLAQPAGLVADITALQLTVSGASAENKVYDGTTDAVVAGAVLEGVLGGDDVSLEGATSGEFAIADTGTGIAVTINMSLSGADAGNYTVAQPDGLVADITAKELTLSGASAEDKVYDGTTAAVVSGGTLEGVIGEDEVSLEGGAAGEFASADAGTGIAVTITDMNLSGADAGNYTLVQPGGFTADITPRDLTVTADDKSREKCFDNPDFTLSFTGFIGAEDQTVLDELPTAACDANAESAAGTYDITVSGGSDNNYSFVYMNGMLTVTPDVTPPTLEVKDITVQLPQSGTVSITADDVVVNTSDNCGVGDATLSQSEFTTADVGVVNVTVTLSDVNGNETTAVSKVTVEAYVGVGETEETMARVFPNPTYGVLQIELDRPADGLRVMDLTGKTVLSRSAVEVDDSIDLEEFNAGIYVVALQFGEEVVYYKIVKK